MNTSPGDVSRFRGTLTYRGRGRASFLNPRWSADGEATVRVSTTGEIKIEMTVETYQLHQQVRGGTLGLFYETMLVEENNKWFIASSGGQNACDRLEVEITGTGRFVSEKNVSYTAKDVDLTSDDPTGTPLCFCPLRSRFDVANARVSKYWCLPLINFVSRFDRGQTDVDRHPLRVRSQDSETHGAPDGATRHLAEQFANQLILFKHAGTLGFIEPLPDFETVARQLKQGEHTRVTSAIMVGELGQEGPPDLESIPTWQPLRMILLLSLATGIEVGAPWIETYDGEGRLVQRLHQPVPTSPYQPQYAAIPDILPAAIGHILSCALASPHYSDSRFHLAVFHFIRSAHADSVDEMLRRVIFALESLVGLHKLTRREALENLTDRFKKPVEEILNRAKQEIRALECEAKNEKATTEQEVLRRVANKVANATDIADFGSAVVTLLQRYQLNDAGVIDGYLHAHPLPHGQRNWASVLSGYRGRLIHTGALEIDPGGRFDRDYRIVRHLQDVLVRVLLKMIDYDGLYQPAIHAATAPMKVDWVQPTTTVIDFRLPWPEKTK